MKRTSSAPSMKLIGTMIAPSRASASDATTNPCELCENSAIRSPWRTPRAVSALAVRLTVASSSAYVWRRSP